MRKSTLAMLLAGAFIAAPAMAADKVSEADYKAKKERIDGEYKADMARCTTMKGNAEDVCKAEAKGKQKVAKAEAEAAFKGTAKARTDAAVARAEADYDVAKEKCDDFSGDKKDACQQEAKAGLAKAKSEAQTKRTMSDARKS